MAYAFIQRDLDEHYTRSVDRDMTPILLKILVVLTSLIYLEGAILNLF